MIRIEKSNFKLKKKLLELKQQFSDSNNKIQKSKINFQIKYF